MKTTFIYITTLLSLISITANAQSNKIEQEYLSKLSESFTNPDLTKGATNLFWSKCLGEDTELNSEQLYNRIIQLKANNNSKVAFYKRLNYYMSSSAPIYKRLLEVCKIESITPEIQKNIDEFKGDYAWMTTKTVGVSLFTKSELAEFFKYIQNLGEDKSLDIRCPITEGNKAYTIADSMPQLSGNDGDLLKILNKNIIYPKLEMDNDIQGKVFVRLVICEDGNISEVRVIKGVSPGLDAEAVRAVRLLPKFIPGRHQGKPVKVYFTIPVLFKMI